MKKIVIGVLWYFKWSWLTECTELYWIYANCHQTKVGSSIVPYQRGGWMRHVLWEMYSSCNPTLISSMIFRGMSTLKEITTVIVLHIDQSSWVILSTKWFMKLFNGQGVGTHYWSCHRCCCDLMMEILPSETHLRGHAVPHYF